MRRFRGGVTVVAAAVTIALCTTGQAVAGLPKPPAEPSSLTNLDDFSSNKSYATFYGQKLVWSADACRSADIRKNDPAECAKVTVPKDWHDITKGSITVLIAKRNDVELNGKRVLFSNPGGPGGKGAYFGALALPKVLGVEATHVGIGIDPRGVGASTPITCSADSKSSPGSYLADGDNRTYTKEGVLIAAEDQRKLIADCVEENKDLAPFINSEQTARDFNLVRHLLGYQQADYYGVSYGTWLGSLMRRMFPTRFDRVVLDGNVDWSQPLEATFVAQAEGMQAAYDKLFLTYVAKMDSKYHLGTTPEEVNTNVEAIRAELVRLSHGARAAGFDNELASSMYSAFGFHDRAYSLSKNKVKPAAKKSVTLDTFLGKQKAQIARSGGWDFAYPNIRCADSTVAKDASSWFDQHEQLAKTYPLRGGMTLMPYCSGWTHAPAIPASTWQRPVGALLMIQQEGDPATPYPGAKRAHDSAPDTRMVVADDMPWHGLSGRYSTCVASTLDQYLKQGILPSGDVSCQSGPLFGEDRPAGGKTPRFELTETYEFMNPGQGSQLPNAYNYARRDLSPMPLDSSARAARERAGTTSTRPSKSVDSDMAARRATEIITEALAQEMNTFPTGS